MHSAMDVLDSQLYYQSRFDVFYERLAMNLKRVVDDEKFTFLSLREEYLGGLFDVKWLDRMRYRRKMLDFEERCVADKSGDAGTSLAEQHERLTMYELWLEEFEVVFPLQHAFEERSRSSGQHAADEALISRARNSKEWNVRVAWINEQEAVTREEFRLRVGLEVSWMKEATRAFQDYQLVSAALRQVGEVLEPQERMKMVVLERRVRRGVLAREEMILLDVLLRQEQEREQVECEECSWRKLTIDAAHRYIVSERFLEKTALLPTRWQGEILSL